MDAVDILFSRDGRIGRLMYFLASLALQVLVSVAAFLLAVLLGMSVALAAITAGILSPGAILVGLMFLALFLGAFYVGVNLTAKRLHDMGQSGKHALWIQGAGLMFNLLGNIGHPGLALIFALVALCGGLWVLFTPGEPGPNRYGVQMA